ncbi:MAG: M48 family metallopeptidase [Armatimonadota bacterium]
MYNAISSNIWKSFALVAFFVALITGIGYVFAHALESPAILPIAVVVAVISSVGSYYYSDRMVLAVSHAHPATREEHAHLINSVEGLALAAGLPAPSIYVIDDPSPNAFATGRDPKHAVICVTTGLMEKLNRIELEGVIGHEMSHIKDYDIRLMALVAVLAGTVVLMSDWMIRSFWFRGRRDNRNGNAIFVLLALVLALLSPLAATVIQLAVSRNREYLADAEGAMLTRYPEGLASALEKIDQAPEPLKEASKATAHLFIANPLKKTDGFLSSLFSTHPPIEERIRRLRTM